LDVERLHGVLERFTVGVARAEPMQGSSTPSAASLVLPPPVNLARFNGVTGGDAEFAHELIELFIVSANEQLREAAGALSAQDRVQLGRTAHKLKGACANIHADGLRSLAAELELNAAAAEYSSLGSLLTQLGNEFKRAREFLSGIAASEGHARTRHG
jgi:HPt (histidine-containing phosphotransfer) domain-containing protein